MKRKAMSNQISIWDIVNKEKLILENQNLIWAVIKRFKANGKFLPYGKTFDDDDLFQIGMIGLIKAAEKYNPTNGAKFSTYATWAIENTFRNELRKNSIVKSGSKVYQSHDSITSSMEDHTINDHTTTEDTEEIKALDIHIMFSGMIKAHPEKEKLLNEVETYVKDYGNGYSWADVARKHNIKYSDLQNKLSNLKKIARTFVFESI